MEDPSDKLLDWALAALAKSDAKGAASLYEQYAEKICNTRPELARFYRRLTLSIAGRSADKELLRANLLGLSTQMPTLAAIDDGLTAALTFLKDQEIDTSQRAIVELLCSNGKLLHQELTTRRSQGKRSMRKILKNSQIFLIECGSG